MLPLALCIVITIACLGKCQNEQCRPDNLPMSSSLCSTTEHFASQSCSIGDPVTITCTPDDGINASSCAWGINGKQESSELNSSGISRTDGDAMTYISFICEAKFSKFNFTCYHITPTSTDCIRTVTLNVDGQVLSCNDTKQVTITCNERNTSSTAKYTWKYPVENIQGLVIDGKTIQFKCGKDLNNSVFCCSFQFEGRNLTEQTTVKVVTFTGDSQTIKPLNAYFLLCILMFVLSCMHL